MNMEKFELVKSFFRKCFQKGSWFVQTLEVEEL